MIDIVQEEWKDIVVEKNGTLYDYTGLYQVSNLGRVKSLANSSSRKEKILKVQPQRGYVVVQLHKDGTREFFGIHRLVAAAFVPNPDNLPVVNHKNEIKDDNRVENLEWCTVKYNTNYGSAIDKRVAKCSGGKHYNSRKVICLNNNEVFDSIRLAADWCGQKETGGISRCCRRKGNVAGKHPVTKEPLHWMYYDEWLEQQKQ